MSYHRNTPGGLGETAPASPKYVPVSSKAVAVQQQAAVVQQQQAAATKSSIGTLLVIGALGVGGFLLYRRFKKKGSAPHASSSTPPASST